MISRVRIAPVEPLARRLAAKPAAARASTSAALAALEADGHYSLAVIERHIDRVRARAAQLVVAAASDEPWALRLGWVRDLVSASTLVGLIVYAWGILA